MTDLVTYPKTRPIKWLPIGFLGAIAVCTALLSLPQARSDSAGPGFVEALFTATSATTVTGLVVVDTETYWSTFGQLVIIGFIKLGGFGIMTASALLGLLVSRRINIQSRLATQSEVVSGTLGKIRPLLVKAFVISVVVEVAVGTALAVRFATAYEMGLGEAAWKGFFHGVSAFNSGGFSLFSNSLSSFATDPLVTVPIIAAAVIGGLGVPVIFEIVRRGHGRKKWSLHTKLTLVGTSFLFVGGFMVFLLFEWTNPNTLGGFSWNDRFLPALFQSVVARSSGFNSIEVGEMHEHSQLSSIILMFIGGGSASTAGGIKVTTFFLLLAVIWAEVRGEPDVSLFRTRVSNAVIRQALSIALLYVAFIAFGTLLVQGLTDHNLLPVLFEVTSAAATVGQSTGITAELNSLSHVILSFLMFVGRVGPIAIATALAVRHRPRRYRFPEDRPIVGLWFRVKPAQYLFIDQLGRFLLREVPDALQYMPFIAAIHISARTLSSARQNTGIQRPMQLQSRYGGGALQKLHEAASLEACRRPKWPPKCFQGAERRLGGLNKVPACSHVGAEVGGFPPLGSRPPPHKFGHLAGIVSGHPVLVAGKLERQQVGRGF